MDEDRVLVSRFRQGDHAAFDLLFRRHKDGVYGLVQRTVGADAADDVVQEVFIQIYKSLRRFRGEASFRTWAYRVTLNVCRDFVRRRVRHQARTSTDNPDALACAADPSVSAGDLTVLWTRDELEQALRGLPDSERTAVELHYVQRLSYRETAAVLGCPDGTIKARIHSAMAKLRLKLHHLAEEVDGS